MKTADELKEYSKSKLKRGYPEGELRNDLLKEGYTYKQIQEAIYTSTAKSDEKKLDSNPFWYISSILIIILGFYKSSNNSGSNTWGIVLIVSGIISILAKIVIPLFENNKTKE
jgi:hypothetical protein